jgi:uncharacterized protein YfaT (DUF1175 family)
MESAVTGLIRSLGLLALLLSAGARAVETPALDPQQSQVFRAWFVRIAQEQLSQARARAGISRTAPGWCACRQRSAEGP